MFGIVYSEKRFLYFYFAMSKTPKLYGKFGVNDIFYHYDAFQTAPNWTLAPQEFLDI